MKIQLPDAIVGDKSTLYEAFIGLVTKYGDQKAYAIELLKLLPQSVKEAPVWFDKLTNMWRYEYGLPFDRLPQQTMVVGTNVYLPVHELYVAVRIADKLLTRGQLLNFLQRLSDRGKHSDVLFEMRPMRDIKANLRTHYEILGRGIGNTTCDWQVTGTLVNVLFDVKNRNKSFVEHLKQIIPTLNSSATNILPTAPNPEDLFKSVENKLNERCYLAQLQGVWIHSRIKEDEDKLTFYFKNSLNKKKVHFVILSDWQDDAFILARNSIIVKVLKRIFRLTESSRFVSQQYA